MDHRVILPWIGFAPSSRSNDKFTAWKWSVLGELRVYLHHLRQINQRGHLTSRFLQHRTTVRRGETSKKWLIAWWECNYNLPAGPLLIAGQPSVCARFVSFCHLETDERIRNEKPLIQQNSCYVHSESRFTLNSFKLYFRAASTPTVKPVMACWRSHEHFGTLTQGGCLYVSKKCKDKVED